MTGEGSRDRRQRRRRGDVGRTGQSSAVAISDEQQIGIELNWR